MFLARSAWYRRMIGGAALIGAAARLASGVILLETGDPTRNTSTPGDNSGWQYEGQFGINLGTPVAPLYFLTANHIGDQGSFIFHGETFTTVDHVKDPGSDLILWKVDHPFTDYAPLFTADNGDEIGRPLRVIGRGTQRGDEIDLDGTARGWQWGPGDDIERWGSNVVLDLPTDSTPPYAAYVHATFDNPGVADEAHRRGSRSGLAYAVQFATDLAAGDWQTGGTESVTAINARWERVLVTCNVSMGTGAPQRFARVAVMMGTP